jgi:hypothetical protein
VTLRKVGDGKSKYLVWRIATFADFVKYLQQANSSSLVIYRGQKEDRPLLPKFARDFLGPDILAREQQLFALFKRQAVSYVNPAPTNDWDWLSIAQHHGLPTRLLDWTRNLLAALWFAVRQEREPPKEEGVVWSFSPPEDDVIRDPDAKESPSPFAGRHTKVFEPRHITPRIRSQDGLFTVHRYVDAKDRFIPLEKNTLHRPRLEKILVPNTSFDSIARDLDRCGVHAASLFQDLDGLSVRLAVAHGWVLASMPPASPSVPPGTA